MTLKALFVAVALWFHPAQDESIHCRRGAFRCTHAIYFQCFADGNDPNNSYFHPVGICLP